MSRKHFIAIAKAVSAIENLEARKLAAEAMADVCSESNPRFNRPKFLEACGVQQ